MIDKIASRKVAKMQSCENLFELADHLLYETKYSHENHIFHGHGTQ